MDNNAVFILNEYRALRAQERRDYVAAVDHSWTAAKAASQHDDAWGFCRMAFQAGQLQLNLGLLQEAVDTCRQLLESEAIKQYPEFESRTRVLLSRILQNEGQMQGALAVARELSRMPSRELSQDGRRSVQHVLVASLAEEGDTEAAWVEALNLVGMLEGVTSPRTIGMAYWTVSNVAFMSSRIDEALENQRLAAEALSRLDDVNLWAQFNKAIAHMRLMAGLNGPETAEFVERAEVAFAVAGGGEIDLYEILITRAWWEFASGNAAKAEGLLRPLEKELAGPYPFLQARALLVLARSLRALGSHAEALECALQCERIFTGIGADVYASESRKLIDTVHETVS
ncbi:hypothetical protein N2K95_04865 [Arthrobacter zhaoxinii]|uniref:MalT-like TPR region domain-containing protein n=1 Tax=Arthrobacter zhaoxinii TaxID=2964616 RepID=A0ABY5YSA4_9MICC|nr:hypothetical protein [Arthrobacter zhaoxinii]UWX98006.1 hypothetical protein N2K95_04865 [Arthrobacter zhaoxinii]